MQIANHTFSLDMTTQTPPGSPPVAAIKPRKVSQNISIPVEFSLEKSLVIKHCNHLLFCYFPQAKGHHLGQNVGEK